MNSVNNPGNKLCNIWNKQSNLPANPKEEIPFVLPALAQSSEKKEGAGIENIIIHRYLERIKQLKQLEVFVLVEGLTVLEEVEKLEEEIEDIKINMLAPLQLLHPLNVLRPFSRLKEFTEWLKVTEPSKRKILAEKKRKKLKEAEEIYKHIAHLRKLIESEEEALFLIKKKIKQSEWAKIEKRLAELNDEIEYQIVMQNEDIKYRIAKQKEERENQFILLNKEREEQVSMLKKEGESTTDNYETLENAEAILNGIEDLTAD